MKKSEKKEQLAKMITEFFKITDTVALTEIRNKIFTEILRLPMSSGDKNNTEEAMYLWNYNSDAYIKNIKSTSAKGTVMADFTAMMKIIDISLLGN
ncbi:hypothetical protein FUA48_05910 [Flavobacterium alkalisoli]|uniref:Uncharacterized protein n=1 Tax=Flavobacterium alkalisoli TaxID=2602769 RepID=A0A5B9FWN5_9FLAO|nr:hypothetical protein [Flavobacterium alkalisoli]QEE49132.1 hypothetical protein FUA48_05910 [Flavobacterium alkalisoli]